MKKLILLALLAITGCTTRVIYMPFLAPDKDSAGRDLFQFYGYEDTLGRWHEWGYPKWKRTLAIPPAKPFGNADEGRLAPVSFFTSIPRTPNTSADV